MIEDMESGLTEAPKTNSNANNSAVAEEANFDEAVTVEAKAGHNM